MSKRFGRNQKRQMQERIMRAERIADQSKASERRAAEELDRMLANSRVIDENGREILIDIEFFQYAERRQREIRTAMMCSGRQDYFMAERLMAEDRGIMTRQSDFIRLLAAKFANGFADKIMKDGWP